MEMEVLLVVVAMAAMVEGALQCEGGRVGECYCEQPTNNVGEHRLSCPSLLPPPLGNLRVEVEVQEEDPHPPHPTGGWVRVKCYPNTSPVHLSTYLKDLHLGNLATVKFINCPVPELPYSQIIQSMGVTGVRRLQLVRSSGSHMDFSGLTSLTSLTVQRGPRLSLSPSLLPPSLRVLELQGLSGLSLHSKAFSSTPLIVNLNIIACKLSTLHEDTFSNLSLLKNLSLHGNHLKELPNTLLAGTPLLESLNLAKNKLVTLPSGFLDNQDNLRSLYLGQNQLSSLPERLLAGKKMFKTLLIDNNGVEKCQNGRRRCSYRSRHRPSLALPASLLTNSSVEELSLTSTNLTIVPRRLLQGCSELRVLRIQGSSFTSLPPDLFSDTSSLSMLDLSYNSLEQLPSSLLHGLTSLTSLRMRGNSLTSLPPTLLAHLTSLTHLDFSRNTLADLPADLLRNNERLFADRETVSLIDLSGNRLKDFPKEILERKSNISESHLGIDQVSEVAHLLNLKKSVVQVATGRKLYKRELDVYRPWLGATLLDLSDNRISGTAAFPGLAGWLVDLSKNLLTSVSGVASGGGRLVLKGNHLVCDCHAAELWSVVRTPESWVLPNTLQCSAPPVALASLPATALTCPVLDNCPELCSCTISISVLTVDCRSRGLLSPPSTLPSPPPGAALHLLMDDNQVEELRLAELASRVGEDFHRISRLSLAGNRLTSLDTRDLPTGLEHLLLEDNMLEELTEENLAHLARPGLEVTIAGNPFLCTCASSPLHGFLQEHYSKVERYQNVTIDCEEETRSLFHLKSDEFCEPLPLLAVMLAASSLLLLMIVLLLLRVFYRDTIIIWVFSKSWGKVFFSEDTVDREKPYDAFLSYSHQDAEYVEESLLPGLESPQTPGELQYRCLIHGRDWEVGAMIPDQILDSVSASRRTVVVLSRSYLNSTWSRMEFQAAHSKTMEEKTQRVILLLHGSLPPLSQMDEDLQKYISANTAIHTDDPWFWQKLRYALPRKRAQGRVRSPSCDTQSTTASLPYRTQVSQEGLIEKEVF